MATLSLQAKKEAPNLTSALSPALAPVYVISLGVPSVQNHGLDAAEWLPPYVWKRLKESHIVYCPQSEKRYAVDMLSFKASSLRTFPLLMDESQRYANRKVYEEVAAEMATEVRRGKKVCIACAGDVSLYASSSYVSEQLQALGVDVRHEPNTSALHTAAALHRLSLVRGEENMLVLSHCEDSAAFRKKVMQVHTVVIFKPRGMWHWLARELDSGRWTWYYTEHMGTKHMFLTTRYADLRDRKIPYFAIIILKRC